MKKIKLAHKAQSKMTGIHTFSFCDVTSQEAQNMEKKIVKTIDHYHIAVKQATLDLHALKAREGTVDEVSLLKATIQAIKRRGHENLKQLYQDLRDISLVRQAVIKNILPTAGRSVVAQWITGDNTFDADNGANFGSLGTDNTAPTNGDTALGAETFRKATSSATTSSNVAFLSNFYTATEVTGTFEEAGWHIDGTITTDSGELFSHFLTGSIVKTNVETLTVESQITVS